MGISVSFNSMLWYTELVALAYVTVLECHSETQLYHANGAVSNLCVNIPINYKLELI